MNGNGFRAARVVVGTFSAAFVLTSVLASCGTIPWQRTAGADPGIEISDPGVPSSTPDVSTVPATPSADPSTAVPEATQATPKTPATASTTTSPSAPTTPATPTDSVTPTTPAKPAPPARTSLRVGDSGPKVLALQQRLTDLGYWLGTPDGKFGNLTQQAVFALQKSAGIDRDGSVGKQTTAALDRGVRPSTRISGNGVEVNLAKQVIMIVRSGKVIWILNTSTGGGYTYESKHGPALATTPRGTFRVWHVVEGVQEGDLGNLYRPRYFNASIAIHGAGSVPAYPVSHGCARVSNAAMDMIWARNYLPMGSTVVVS